MKIRKLVISHFRGINHFEWILPDKNLYCLIGPGDSTKSTILDAIEWALTPRWNMSIYDTDFYNCDVNEPIDIQVTCGDLPESFLSLDKFGDSLRGWKDNRIFDEPVEGSEEIITIHLVVDSNLEPNWSLLTERGDKPRQISSRARESLGMVRIGSYTDRHLTWGHGSALSRLTENTENINGILANAGRMAREAVSSDDLPDLKSVADRTHSIVSEYGIKPKGEFHPALDPTTTNENGGAISLFDGKVPARQSGLGTKRLLIVAIQQNCIEEGSLQLIDEIEQGLEPYRVRHLLYILKNHAPKTRGKNQQMFITSHSRDVIEELTTTDLFIVRSNDGITSIQGIDKDLQGTIRAESMALLSRKIIVCEGKTELGICRMLDRKWQNEAKGKPFAHYGIIPVDGGGTDAATKRAIHLQMLGYGVAYFVDGDKTKEKDINNLRNIGVEIIVWDEKLCTEQRLCRDIPWHSMQKIVDLAINIKTDQSIRDQIANQLGCRSEQLSNSIEDWKNLGFDEDLIRDSICNASLQKEKTWFKEIDFGESLGEIIYDCLGQLNETDLGKKIGQLKTWCYA